MVDTSFNFVSSKDAMLYIADKPALYAEMFRVSRLGGRLIAADWLWSEGATKSVVVDAWLSRSQSKTYFMWPATTTIPSYPHSGEHRSIMQAALLDPPIASITPTPTII
ncbi:hypothetical protein [Mesorhizobium atlanticum]|uniref:Methyltransferase type 11 domain-containing protein n=1 Tax=Mesorhizobium atlanticum TaxID=2233532 RepID=A0A330GK19_9HYPH|nr:hypothetical protein [Mesorhizobium atlanticum]RAZ73023.1 hypothetical protein DPM35_27005 [Mesorhizobium atlanticum]